METAEALTRWTVRGAFALYVLALALRSGATDQVGRRPSADHARQRAAGPLLLAHWLWTVGCALMFAHVGLAFDAFHHWSHRAAYDETARQTAELFGIDWGGGLFANYALLLVWLLDATWWWRGIELYELRRRTVTWIIQGFLAFMWFNATVVFGHGWVRWAGLGGFALLAVCHGLSWIRLNAPDD